MNQILPDQKKNQKTMDARKFADVAETIFAPIYPVIARQILTNTSICSGVALDIGTGPGHLATALAKASALTVHALDLSPEMLEMCEKRIFHADLVDRVLPVRGDVSSIPFPDKSFDLVVSRGSWFFWENLAQAFSEIYRVLKPGGKTYIGGGFGDATLKKQIVEAMKSRDSTFESGMKERLTSRSPNLIVDIMQSLKISEYSIINDDSGIWLVMVHS